MRTAGIATVLFVLLSFTAGLAQTASQAASTIGPQLPIPAPKDRLPSAPKVSLVDDQLTIDADNSTLADVLSAVARTAKIDMDVAPAAGAERVIAHFGPGKPADVLTDFLQATRFDYVLATADAHSAQIRSVSVLAPATRGAAAEALANAARPQPPQRPVPEPAVVEAEASPRNDVVIKEEPAARPATVAAATAPAAPVANPVVPSAVENVAQSVDKQAAQNQMMGTLLQLYHDRQAMLSRPPATKSE